jgi:hypothetical protein
VRWPPRWAGCRGTRPGGTRVSLTPTPTKRGGV